MDWIFKPSPPLRRPESPANGVKMDSIPSPPRVMFCGTTLPTCSPSSSLAQVPRCFQSFPYLQVVGFLKPELVARPPNMFNNLSKKDIYDGIPSENFWRLRCLWNILLIKLVMLKPKPWQTRSTLRLADFWMRTNHHPEK